MKPNNQEKETHVVEEHQEWVLEKQTEGLDPKLDKDLEKLEEEVIKEAAEA